MEARHVRRFGQAPPLLRGRRRQRACRDGTGVLPFGAQWPGWPLQIAIGCAVVAAEFSSTLIERTRHYHTRLHQLASNLTVMRGEIASADREIAGMRTAVAVDDGWRRIIAEPDARLIRLKAAGSAAEAGGVIAFSPRLRRAAIEIGGMPALAKGRAYMLWWISGKRGPLRAARIGLGTLDGAALMIALPDGGEAIERKGIITTDLPPSMVEGGGRAGSARKRSNYCVTRTSGNA